jgi:hypothetical protein
MPSVRGILHQSSYFVPLPPFRFLLGCLCATCQTDALRRHQKSRFVLCHSSLLIVIYTSTVSNRHNGVVIELPNTDRRDDHLSEGSQSRSRSPTPSKNISAATPESASAGGASAPGAPIAGPSTYYRAHTSDNGKPNLIRSLFISS